MSEGPRSKRLKLDAEKKRKLIVILENCSLESAKIGGDYVILSSDKHQSFLKKMKKDPTDYRPDILHQCLLMLLDSPLNRAGLLQIYFRTNKNVLVEVSPQCRIPRTFDRFCGLMVQLLSQMTIRAADTSQKLLRVIKNPITQHLPVGCVKYLMSFAAEEIVHPRDLAKQRLDNEEPIVIVIGGIARGKITTDYTERDLKINNYPLSAALTCAKVTSGFEEAWEIV